MADLPRPPSHHSHGPTQGGERPTSSSCAGVGIGLAVMGLVDGYVLDLLKTGLILNEIKT